jgi:hypothetical protein
MSKKDKSEPSNEIYIGGDVSGPIAIGENISQTQSVQAGPSGFTKQELTTISELIDGLKRQVSSEAPPDKRQPALERLSELEQTITAQEPDVATLAYVRNWFVKNIPQVADSVTELLANPIFGKVSGAAGAAIAHELKRRLGSQ